LIFTHAQTREKAEASGRNIVGADAETNKKFHSGHLDSSMLKK